MAAEQVYKTGKKRRQILTRITIVLCLCGAFFSGCPEPHDKDTRTPPDNNQHPRPIPPVSLETLLDEMIDRDSLTRFPEPAYICSQASSYDRRSTSPANSNWFANNDFNQFIREENNNGRSEFVLMDAKGPGAIVRWWITATNYQAVFRVYFDNSNEPAIQANIGSLIGGNFLVGSPLSAERATGRNLYLPIPYSGHCKVTVSDIPSGASLYYNIDYRTYPPGTAAKTFSMDNLESLSNKIDSVQNTLFFAGEAPDNVYTAANIIIPKGGSYSFSKINLTQNALKRIVLKIDAEDENLAQALRSTVISIKFDDRETVWCPLGDFFGSGIGLNPYKSWFTRADHDGTLISMWSMPFKSSAEVSLINYGDKDFAIDGYAFTTDPYRWDSRSMYFHADWRQERNISTAAGRDWNYTKINGQGIYAGDVLSLLNRDPAWWGEGDEKIYVDLETFPSHFGTGSEDYYGYAWCKPIFFEAPFHFQPRAEGPGNYGNTTNGRVRLLDGITFMNNFRFDMEILHHRTTSVDYAVTTFWYAFDGARLVDFQSRQDQITEAVSPVYYVTPEIDIFGYLIENPPTGGVAEYQNMRNYGSGKWNNDGQMWWHGGGPGDTFDLILETNQAGSYRFVAELTMAKDYGIIQFWVNGEKAGGQIDLYNTDVIPTGPIDVAAVNLTAGRQSVRIEITGKNDSSSSYMVGIDRLRFLP